jgi:pilus assembly protein CpaB
LTGVGGFVQPGDKIDVLWTLKVPGPSQQEAQAVTLTLFQGIQVLATGTRTTPTRPPPATEEAKAGAEKLDKPFTVTLALSPQEAALLSFARQQGSVQLSLRATREEEQRVAVAPANITTLMEAALGPEAAEMGGQPAAGADMRTVEVYKGLERSVQSVPSEE